MIEGFIVAKKLNTETPSLFAVEEPVVDVAPPPGFPAPWVTALASEFGQPYFTKLQEFVTAERQSNQIFPAETDVFNAYRFAPLDDVKVVLLGQDPYPTPGHAHGLCFSVRPGVVIPASLRNIYQERQSDLGLPPMKHGYLASWAAQGILMLNAVLTVRSGMPNSHANKGWEKFTDATLKAVNAKTTPVVFVLWGGYAQKKRPLIDESRHSVIASAHPSPLSANVGFFGSKPFSKINAKLTDKGLSPIDWTLPDKVV